MTWEPKITIRIRVRHWAVAWAVVVWAFWASAVASAYYTAGFDFDEVMMVAMGFAGLAYVVADLKRERRLDECAMDHENRIASLEADKGWKAALDLDTRLDNLSKRVARLEERDDLHDRVIRLEAREKED